MGELEEDSIKEINQDDIEQIEQLNTTVTPVKQVTRTGIKKLIDFFKKQRKITSFLFNK